MTNGELVAAQRAYFETGVTRSAAFRKEGLLRLQRRLEKREQDLLDALYQDLNKSAHEAQLTELGVVREELSYTLRHMDGWAKVRRVSTPFTLMPAKSRLYPEPYGVTLIMSPWNYPVQLCLVPLISALAAGNCVVLKPSAYAPATSGVLASVLSECFPPEYVSVVEGGRLANVGLLAQKFDYIFFTGSPAVGKTVLEAAAKNLTPVTLELGGKSPCVIDKTADLELAAARVAFGKGVNAGQTCVAPDYLLVQKEVKDELIALLRKNNRIFYGENPCENPSWPKIINEKHFDRLQGLMAGESVVAGGEYRTDVLKIAPTILDNVSFDAPVMQEEIFGPILPVIPFENLNEALLRIRERPRPLAFYMFSTDKTAVEWALNTLSFGGSCINDTLLHLANVHLPFGGVGNSGMGAYHGKAGFDAFTHQKSVLKRGGLFDISLRYPPFTDEKAAKIKKLMK